MEVAMLKFILLYRQKHFADLFVKYRAFRHSRRVAHRMTLRARGV